MKCYNEVRFLIDNEERFIDILSTDYAYTKIAVQWLQENVINLEWYCDIIIESVSFMDKKTMTSRLTKRACVKELYVNQAAYFFDKMILLLHSEKKEKIRCTLLQDVIDIDISILRRIGSRRLLRTWYVINCMCNLIL